MRALLVGGNGFIGSHVQDILLAHGHEVRVLDRFPERYRGQRPGVEFIVGSPREPLLLNEAMVGADLVIYMASTSVPTTSNSNIALDIDSNLVPLVLTLDEMAARGVKRIVYLSSGGTVYGAIAPEEVPETAPTDPICSYGVVKLASEKYLGMYQRLHGLRPLILRPSNVFGPRQGHEGVQGFVGTALTRLLKSEPIDIWGDGSVIRDYLYVGDLAAFLLEAIDADAVGVVNVGSGEGRSLLEVIDTLRQVTGVTPEVRFQEGRDYDVPRLILDITRASELVGWTPTTSFEEGVRLHWEWLRENNG